jgi:hypothetical protein
MRNPCETHAKPILQSLAPNAMLELPDPGMLGTLLQIGAGPQRLWMSLDVSGLVQSCPGCNMSAVQEFTYADATFISFISFPLPGTFCRAATRYPASSLIGRAVKPSRPPNQWWMHGD